MDPITIIVNALISGIIEGVSAGIVRESYMKIRTLLFNKYSSLRNSIEQLEEAPEPMARWADLEEDLRKAGVDKDEDILKLCGELLSVIESAKPDISKNAPNKRVSPDELIEIAERDAGSKAIEQVVEGHIERVLNVRQKYPLSNIDLLSSNIVTVTAPKLPKQIKLEIGRLQDKIRIIIQEIAARIEERKYKTAEEAIENLPFAYTERIKAYELVKADKKIQLSYQTLKTTIEYFSNFNQTIINKLSQSPSVELETNLVLGNAILIYEVTDFLINYIENFEINGLEEIFRLHKETKSKITELRRKEEALRGKIESEDVDTAIREQTLQDIETRERSIQTLENEWEEYTKEIQLFKGEVNVIQKKLPTLEVIRENAKRQLELISVVAILQVIKQNINTMHGAILTLEKIKLVSLNPTRIRRLLGIK